MLHLPERPSQQRNQLHSFPASTGQDSCRRAVKIVDVDQEALSEQVGFAILCNRFTDIGYDQTGFTPSFEFVEEFPACYDMVFVLSDDGYGVEVFVQKEKGVPPELLAMCQRYAVQGTT